MRGRIWDLPFKGYMCSEVRTRSYKKAFNHKYTADDTLFCVSHREVNIKPHMSRDMRFPRMSYVRPTNFSTARAYAHVLVAWIFYEC